MVSGDPPDDAKRRKEVISSLVNATSRLLIELVNRGAISRKTYLHSLKDLYEATEAALVYAGLDPSRAKFPINKGNGKS